MGVIFTADIHTCEQIWNGRPEISGDSEFVWWQLSQECCSHRADLVLGGDVTDTRLGRRHVVELVQRYVEQILDADLRVAYIAGNHDPESWVATNPSLKSRTINLAGSSGFEMGGRLFYGLDYMPRTLFQTALSNIPPEYEVLVCHQRFHEAFGMDTAHACLDDVPAHVQFVLAGDIHQKFETMNDRNQLLVYPGCPYLRKTNDPVEHGVWHFSESMARSWLPLLHRPAVRMQVESSDDLDSVLSAVLLEREKAQQAFPAAFQSVADPLLLLRYYPDETPDAPHILAEQLRGKAHVFDLPLERVSEQLLAEIRAQQMDKSEVGELKDFLSKEVDPEDNPILFSALDSLLTGSDVSDVVRDLARQHGVPEAQLLDLIPRR